MPIETDLNVAPYFDDFDEDKNYHRVLFRPATAVQARELTQLQTILQSQIERFGNWAFKNGDIVSGCAINDIPVLPYVRLDDFAANGSSFDAANLQFTRVVSNTTGLQATVIMANNGFADSYPNTNVIYVQYTNTGTNGEKEFSNTDQLSFYSIPLTGNAALDNVATINVFSNAASNTTAVGNAHGISIGDGIVYINGNFVRIANVAYGIVNNFGTYAGNNVVGIIAEESIITENQDSSLFDNALGYDNENAPGAHRLKIAPGIISLSEEAAANTQNFNPIVAFNFGSLIMKSSTKDVNSILATAMANRTYEESGNYVIRPFSIDATSEPFPGVASEHGANGVFARVSPGAGYAQGHRVELLNSTYIDMRRGVDTEVFNSQQITFNYGNYFVINQVSGHFPFDSAQTVYFYDTPFLSVTNRTFGSTTVSGTQIGSAKIRCFSYLTGTIGTELAQYALHVFDIKMNGTYNTNQIRSVYYNGTTKGFGDLAVFGLQDSSVKEQIFNFGVNGIKNLRDESNNVSTQYIYRKTQSGYMNSNGQITITLPASATGGVDILPYGTAVKLNEADSYKFTVVPTATRDTANLAGNCTITSGSANIVGTSTSFRSKFAVGDLIKINSAVRAIVNVVSDTIMIADANFASSGTFAYYKEFPEGKMLPISQYAPGVNTYIEISNTTSFVINTNNALPAGCSMPVEVIFDVLRTSAAPAKKVIRKNRYVKINIANNEAGVNGPWCLGFSDVHKINKIYASSDGTYSTDNADVTNRFVFDSGQLDTHYGLGFLYARPGYNVKARPNLLVELDYFSVNTTPGVGFFTIESYPIDDANTANTNAIQTKDIPLYVSENGLRNPLKDVVDFRPYANNTASDTGAINTANSTQVAAAIAAASLNPSSNIVINSPGSGLHVPSFGQNLQADYTRYLARKDLIYITPDNILKVKEGASGVKVQAPLSPENAMPLAVLTVPPYPSLSSDQADQLNAVNIQSRNLCRDVSTVITSTIITNKRYTMRDIGKIDQRISNLEFYTQLNTLELKAKDMTVTDANGLDRFKNGIFVDPFSDFTLSEVTNPEYTIAIDQNRGIARPNILRETVQIQFDVANSPSVQKTGRLITLPYTQVSFLVQPKATKYRNAALVAFAYNGTLMLVPSYDDRRDIINAGSVNFTVDLATPWKDFANGPFGSIWGDWNTTQQEFVDKVVSETRKQVTLELGYFATVGDTDVNDPRVAAYAQQLTNNVWVELNKKGYSQADYILGNVTVQYTNMKGQSATFVNGQHAEP